MTNYDLIIAAILAGTYLACGLGLIVILALEARRPPNDMDRKLSRLDQEIELSERERAIARGLGGGFRG